MKLSNTIKFLISIIVPVGIGAVSGLFTSSNVKTWFVTVAKPSFNPPSWIFAPVWTTLYFMMGFALFLIWKNETVQKSVKQKAILLFAIQMILNFLWSFIFFQQHEIGWALVDIILLWIFILLTIFSFAPISKTAAWLLVPYISWVSFATILNFAIWQLNR
jgi:tryptophan-rich sensory protein